MKDDEFRIGGQIMTKFSSRLKEAMESRGIRAAKLSDMTGISPPRISQYIHGKYIPNGDALCQLAQALLVDEAWLMGKDVPMDPLPLPENASPMALHYYPVLGQIACGQPLLAVQEHSGFAVSTDDRPDFCLTAKGDSMIGARIFDGDEVFIQTSNTVNNGDIAAVIVDDEATLKRVYYYPTEERLVLVAENPAYPPMEFTGDQLNDIHILGRAVSVNIKL